MQDIHPLNILKYPMELLGENYRRIKKRVCSIPQPHA